MSNPDEPMRPAGESLAAGAEAGLGLGFRIAAQLAGGDFEYEIPEWRGATIEPMQFGELDWRARLV
jgi:hypothetical protein